MKLTIDCQLLVNSKIIDVKLFSFLILFTSCKFLYNINHSHTVITVGLSAVTASAKVIVHDTNINIVERTVDES